MAWAIVGGGAILIAGAIQWIGLPPEPSKDDAKEKAKPEPADAEKVE